MFEGPFPEPRIPTEIEPDEQFQQDLVKAFIGKTKYWAKESDDSSESSDDDSFISKKSKRHRKKQPVKTVTVEKNGIKSEKNRVVKDRDKDDDKMVIERMENKTDERLDENADMVSQRLEFQTDKNVENEKELNFVENYYRNSFSHGTNTVNSDDMNDRNISESSQNRCEIHLEENRNLDTKTTTEYEKINCGQNGFIESELSSSHEQHAGKSYNDSIEKDRTDENDEFIMVSELGVKENAEGKQIGMDIEGNSDYERLKELLNEKELNLDMKDGASSFCDNLVDSNSAIVEVQEPNKVPCERDGNMERCQVGPEKPARSSTNTVLDNCAMDVPFMGKLVRTQVTCANQFLTCEPSHEKTNNLCLRPGPTQTGL